MSKDKLTDYDATASNNTDVGGISVAEGMLPSGVNNAIREQMSHLKDFAAGTVGIDVLSLADDDASHAIKLQAPSAVTADTTFTLPDGDGASGQTMITDGAGTLAWAAPYGNRNLIINGAMQVAQRGTSFTASGFSLDRWYHQLSGGTSTTTQETFALGSEVAGCSKYLKQATSTGNDYCGLVYKVEDVKSIHQGKATFSFYAKGTNPAGGSYTVRIGRINTGTTFFDTPLNSTVTLTSSWQRFVYTFDVASFSGMGTIDNTSHVYISIHQPASDAGTAAWELNLTGVQLELGEQATPFEHRSYADELIRCQRYYEKINVKGYFSAGVAGNALSTYGASVSLSVAKRSTPTITLPPAGNTTGTIAFVNGTANFPTTIGTNSVAFVTDNRFSIRGTGYAGLTTGQVALVYAGGTVSLEADAEL